MQRQSTEFEKIRKAMRSKKHVDAVGSPCKGLGRTARLCQIARQLPPDEAQQVEVLGGHAGGEEPAQPEVLLAEEQHGDGVRQVARVGDRRRGRENRAFHEVARERDRAGRRLVDRQLRHAVHERRAAADRARGDQRLLARVGAVPVHAAFVAMQQIAQ